jgi:hypothetical protein
MGEKIRSYRELRVYQSAMEAAMEIFHLTKNFYQKKSILLLTKSDVLPVQYVQILLRLGVKDDIRLHLLQS